MSDEEKEQAESEVTAEPVSEPEAESKPENDRSAEESVPSEEPAGAATAVSGEPVGVETAAAGPAAAPIEKKPIPWALYLRLGGFVTMLTLAIVGMHLIRIEYTYVWIYWLVVVLVFMVVSFTRGYQGSKLRGETLTSALSRHFMHWGGLIIVLGIMMILQDYDRIDVNVSANILLLLLALTCYLAGVHFDRLFIVVGAFLGVIALLATLESEGMIWGISVLVALLALGSAFLHFRAEAKEDTTD